MLSQPLDSQIQLRQCRLGEIIQNSICAQCLSGTFSFNLSDSVCSNCPDGVTCYGGSNTTLDKNYWRPSNTSERLMAYLAQDICLGGNKMRSRPRRPTLFLLCRGLLSLWHVFLCGVWEHMGSREKPAYFNMHRALPQLHDYQQSQKHSK